MFFFGKRGMQHLINYYYLKAYQANSKLRRSFVRVSKEGNKPQRGWKKQKKQRKQYES